MVKIVSCGGGLQRLEKVIGGLMRVVGGLKGFLGLMTNIVNCR